jgi:hypothetical protein
MPLGRTLLETLLFMLCALMTFEVIDDISQGRRDWHYGAGLAIFLWSVFYFLVRIKLT